MHPTTSLSPVRRTPHPRIVRITHWVNALAILIMMLSGWRIYNASPLFGFEFPASLTLGGWLAGALQWHFAGMWLLVLNGLVFLTYAVFSGHLRAKLWPQSVAAIFRDLRAARKGELVHTVGSYNMVQRAAYCGVIVLVVVLVASGLALWKPVQLYALAVLMGDYEGARLVHFFAMALLVLFLAVHLVMVALLPATFLPMLAGRMPREAHRE